MSAKDTEILNKAYDKLFTPLPPALGGSTNPEEENKVEKVKEFLRKHVPKSDQKEIDEEFKKNVPLSKQLKKKIKQPQPTRKGKYLTAREKKDLGLSKLDKDGLRFETFKKLHYLWLDYMREIIDFGKIETSETAIDTGAAYGGRMPAVLDENLQLKICRADMHGCLMKVTRALNSCLIGIQGIVVMETRHTFQIIDKKNILRNVPKSGTCFTFVIDGLLITISGSSFVMKPHERAVRKWKRKPTFEM